MRGMSPFLLLVLVAVVCEGYPQQPQESQCITACPRSCSPTCLPTCCSGSGVLPASGTKPPMEITSVEEGETQTVEEGKGFGNPDDNSFDPPGTITIPLPPTVYEPPKPGEEAKEMPLPEMKLPASIFEGKLPSESMTISPEGTKLAPGATLPLEHMAPDGTTSKAPITPVTDLNPSPPAPAPPMLLPVQTPVLSQPPLPPPPMSTGGSLAYPKLPPVLTSEIPNRVNRQPPLILPKPKGAASLPVVSLPKAPVLPAITLPKPPAIHVSGEPVMVNTQQSTPVQSTPVLACGKSSCETSTPPAAKVVRAPAAPAAAVGAPAISVPSKFATGAPAPVHKYAQPAVVEKQQDMRFGVSYGKSKRS